MSVKFPARKGPVKEQQPKPLHCERRTVLSSGTYMGSMTLSYDVKEISLKLKPHQSQNKFCLQAVIEPGPYFLIRFCEALLFLIKI